MKKMLLSLVAIAAFATITSAQTKTDAASSNKPKATYIYGQAKVTVWENEKQGKYGPYIAKSFKVEKIYKKDDKTWETTNNFDEEDLLQLRSVIDRVINDELVRTKD